MQKLTSSKIISIIFGVLVLLFLVGFYALSWTGPPGSPPYCPSGYTGCAPPVPATGGTMTGDLIMNANINITGTNVYKRGGTSGVSQLCAGGTTPSGITISGGIITSAGSCTGIGGGAGEAYWVLSGSNLYASSTTWNVGIGTPSPGAKLEVAGQIKITGGSPGAGKVLTSDTSGLASWQTLAGGGNVSATGTPAAGQVAFFTDATTITGDSQFAWHTTQKALGLGYWYGSYRLYVSGNDLGSSSMALRRGSGDIYSSNIRFFKSRGTATSPTAVASGDQLGALWMYGYDGSAFVSGAGIVFTVDGTPGTNDMPGRIEFYTVPDGSTSTVERMRINNAGALGFGGANYGNSGQVLKSRGSGATPVWADAPVGGYDAIVAPSGGDYTTVGAALAAGKRKIYVKVGTYTEDQLSMPNEPVTIIGEKRESTILTTTVSGWSYPIYIANAQPVYIENLTIRGHETGGAPDSYYIIYMENRKGPLTVVNCIFQKTAGSFIFGNYSVIQAYNCKFDATGKTSAVDALVRDAWGNSVIEGCEFISDPAATDMMPILDYIEGLVHGCYLKGNKGYIGVEGEGLLMGNYISFRNLWTGGGGAFIGNFFDNNQLNPDPNAMVTFQSVQRIVGNRFYTNYYAKKIVKIAGNFATVSSNWFESGGSMDIDNVGIQFNNNTWTAGTADATLTLTTNAQRCQVNENIFKGSGGNPSIVNNGANNNILNNILYY